MIKNAIMRRMVILPFQRVFSDGIKKPNRAIKYDYIKRKEVLEYVLKLVIDLEFEFIQPKFQENTTRLSTIFRHNPAIC